MLYLYASITVTPYSETTCDVFTALLGEIGFDSFEVTDTGIKAYIPKEQFDEASLQSTLDDLFIPDVTCTYTLHDLENKDWNAEWEQNSFDPILEREFGIRLNPRMAFGSGSHETTYQITSFLLQQDFTAQRVLDMGTGTGVLGIAMSMRGAQEVVAIDIDEFSVENARENFSPSSSATHQPSKASSRPSSPTSTRTSSPPTCPPTSSTSPPKAPSSSQAFSLTMCPR